MARINPERFGGSNSKKLRQEDLSGECAILTIADVEQRTVKDDKRPDGERDVLVLRFKETGDRTLWLNYWATEIKPVIAELGDDYDTWVGKQVLVERVTRKYDGQEFKKVAIAAPGEWPEMFKQAVA